MDFVNAFNPLKNWYDSDVIGIDTGIILLMAENLRTGFVWDTFMKSAEAKAGHGQGWFSEGKLSFTDHGEGCETGRETKLHVVVPQVTFGCTRACDAESQ